MKTFIKIIIVIIVLIVLVYVGIIINSNIIVNRISENGADDPVVKAEQARIRAKGDDALMKVKAQQQLQVQ